MLDLDKSTHPQGPFSLGRVLFRCADGWTKYADGCDRCDDVCARRDGKQGRDDYKQQGQGQGQGQGQCTYECGSWPNGGGCTVCSNTISPGCMSRKFYLRPKDDQEHLAASPPSMTRGFPTPTTQSKKICKFPPSLLPKSSPSSPT